MKKIIFLCLLLAGCGGAEDDNNHGYGWEYDYIDNETGLRLRWGDTQHYYPISDFVDAYKEVQQCVGLSFPGPLVIITTKILTSEDGYPVLGLYFIDQHTILISATIFNGDRIDPLTTVRHEYVHHLLEMMNYPRDANKDHDHTAFGECVYLPPKL